MHRHPVLWALLVATLCFSAMCVTKLILGAFMLVFLVFEFTCHNRLCLLSKQWATSSKTATLLASSFPLFISTLEHNIAPFFVLSHQYYSWKSSFPLVWGLTREQQPCFADWLVQRRQDRRCQPSKRWQWHVGNHHCRWKWLHHH